MTESTAIKRNGTASRLESVFVEDLGLIDYQKAYLLQKKYVQDILEGGPQRLLMCEHPSILTLGRLAKPENILYSTTQLENRGIQILPIDRGGDVTLHCPGQLVVYPILRLENYKKDLKYYLSKLEEVGIDFLREFDILTCRLSGRTGVWIKDKKIISIGIGVKKWISFHGMAININTDLNLFSMIRPCGLSVEMTSVRKLKGYHIDLKEAKIKFAKIFCRHFDLISQEF